MKYTEEYIVDVVDYGINFEGIAKHMSKTIFVDQGMKGEKLKVINTLEKSKYSCARIIELQEKSNYRQNPICEVYNKCGGCDSLHIYYDESINIKKTVAINTLKKQGICEDILKEVQIYKMGNPYYYRNKLSLPVRYLNGENIIGMFSKGTNSIIETNNCYIENKEIFSNAKSIFECVNKVGIKCYNEKTKKGSIKNILVRRGVHTGQLMCVLVTTEKDFVESLKLKELVNCIKDINENIVSIAVNVNEEAKESNKILSTNTKVVYGNEFIQDKIGDKLYNISANSFFQVNTIMAEVLYEVCKSNMNFNKQDTLLDLYSGVGSIGIYMADKVKKVIGIEIVESAVEMAKSNCIINNIQNATYYVGDSSKITKKLLEKAEIFNKVIVDPPRKGLSSKDIEYIKEIKADIVGYISCNVATLARDLKLLEDKYTIKNISFIDMFPHTRHVECAVVLKLH